MQNVAEFSQKLLIFQTDFLRKFGKKFANVVKSAKFCKFSKISARQSGRFWKMLSNAYLLAKFRFDTAQNERNVAEILPKTDNYPTDPTAPTSAPPRPSGALKGFRRPGGRRGRRPPEWPSLGCTGIFRTSVPVSQIPVYWYRTWFFCTGISHICPSNSCKNY